MSSSELARLIIRTLCEGYRGESDFTSRQTVFNKRDRKEAARRDTRGRVCTGCRSFWECYRLQGNTHVCRNAGAHDEVIEVKEEERERENTSEGGE